MQVANWSLPETFETNLVNSWTNSTEGILREALEYLAHTGGKRLRARLVFELARQLNLESEAVAQLALAVETLHCATLAHDDFQDGDTIRRGLPTVWAKYGSSLAVTLGDYLLVKPFAIMLQNPSTTGDQTQKLCEILSEGALNLAKGQQLEAEAKTATLSSYLRVCELKTGALFYIPIVSVCLLSRQFSSEQLMQIKQVAQALGVLFQMRDDYIDIFGDKGRDTRGRDLVEGKFGFLQVVCTQLSSSSCHASAVLSQTSTVTEKLNALDHLVRCQHFQSCVTEAIEGQQQIIESALLANLLPANFLQMLYSLVSSFTETVQGQKSQNARVYSGDKQI